MYYLQSRYYNPTWGRFLNADCQLINDKLTGTNLFVYCNNNPINLFDPTGEIAVSTVILIGSIVVGLAVAGYTAYVEYQAGVETPQIVCDSIIAGVSAFMLVYSAGMTAYQCYLNYCYLNSLTPVTEISISSTSQATGSIPQAAKDTLSYIDQTGCAPQGYKGGREFMNDGRNGGQILPSSGSPYHEYDIYPHIKGVDRGTERIVVGSDGSAWYTNDHYLTFKLIRAALEIFE